TQLAELRVSACGVAIEYRNRCIAAAGNVEGVGRAGQSCSVGKAVNFAQAVVLADAQVGRLRDGAGFSGVVIGRVAVARGVQRSGIGDFRIDFGEHIDGHVEAHGAAGSNVESNGLDGAAAA